ARCRRRASPPASRRQGNPPPNTPGSTHSLGWSLSSLSPSGPAEVASPRATYSHGAVARAITAGRFRLLIDFSRLAPYHRNDPLGTESDREEARDEAAQLLPAPHRHGSTRSRPCSRRCPANSIPGGCP